MIGNEYACCFIRALQTFASQRIELVLPYEVHDLKRKYNGNENGHIQIYQFPFHNFSVSFTFFVIFLFPFS